MEYQIIVVGIGPGAPEYLLPCAKQVIEEASVLVGSKRALKTYGGNCNCTCPISGNLSKAAAFIHKQLTFTDVVVLASGDPGYYSILPYLKKTFPNRKIKVIPGISSMQVAFARIALPWQNAVLLSFHGRTPHENELSYKPGKKMGLLTDTKNTTASIAQQLLGQNWPSDSRTYICVNLSYPDEQLIECTLQEAAMMPAVQNCIMVVVAACISQA